MLTLRPYQQQFIADVRQAWEDGNRAVLGVLPTGAGKCLGRDTPVLMADGTVKSVQDVKRGDSLLGPDGGPRLVDSTTQGVEPLYRVTPTKGDSYVVNESHILSFRISGKGAAQDACGRSYSSGDIANVTVRDYLVSSRTFRHRAKGWRAPCVSFTGRKGRLLLPPYILGVWLGDGNSRTPSICSVDAEVVAEWQKYAENIGHRVTAEGTAQSPEYRIASPEGAQAGRGYRTNAALNALRHLNVLQNKHIPQRYKTGSAVERMELLAGVLDTDGYLSNGGYDAVFKQPALANDVAFVARSLGLAAYVKECRKTCTNTGATGTYYRVSVSGETHRIPCRVPRRQAAPRRQKKNVLRHGVTVEPIGPGEYFGFTLSGPDRLFLLGDFTVTHNTVCFSTIAHDHNGAVAAVVHRREIVSQISLALAQQEVKHRVVAPDDTLRMIRRKHLDKLGRSWIDPNSRNGVASVQTLTSKSAERNRELQRWIGQVSLAIFDESHHYTDSGIWGRAVHLFDKAQQLHVTACPERADGKGLGRHADGFVDVMVEGPSTAGLIESGYLSPFRYLAPASDLDVNDIPLTATGDVNTREMRKRIKQSHIVGDVVSHYLQHAAGRKTIVFANDVETAEEIAAAFQAAGVTAAALSGKTPGGERDRALAQFESGALDVLVNVDLFDEGFDVPAVEVAILARVTESLNKFLQMIGRALRFVAGKIALVIDPVRNWERHGMPNWVRRWSLDGREKGSRARAGDLIPQRVCDGCTQPYEVFYPACPYCGAVPEPAGRSTPEQVDGDLTELDVDGMAALLEQIRRADMPDDEYRADQIARRIPAVGRPADLRRHQAGKYRRGVLREVVAWWCGMQQGRSQAEIYRRFYHRFGVDMGKAFTLPARETDELIDRISGKFMEDITV